MRLGGETAPLYVYLHSESVTQCWEFVEGDQGHEGGWGEILWLVQYGNWMAIRDGTDLRLFPTRGSVGTA